MTFSGMSIADDKPLQSELLAVSTTIISVQKIYEPATDTPPSRKAHCFSVNP